MTTRNDHHLDHGDEPMTLEEIFESFEREPVTVRVRLPMGLSAKTTWHPNFEAPDGRRPRRLLDVSDWT